MRTKTINSLGGSCAYILNRFVDSWQLAIGELYFTHIRLNPEWAGKDMGYMNRYYKRSYKALRAKGASYYEAKNLLKYYISSNPEKFEYFGGKVKVNYDPDEGFDVDYSYKGYSLSLG